MAYCRKCGSNLPGEGQPCPNCGELAQAAERSTPQAPASVFGDVDMSLFGSETTLPESETVLPDAELVLPDSETILPDAELILPESEVILPDEELALPEIEEVQPRMPEAQASRPEAVPPPPVTPAPASQTPYPFAQPPAAPYNPYGPGAAKSPAEYHWGAPAEQTPAGDPFQPQGWPGGQPQRPASAPSPYTARGYAPAVPPPLPPLPEKKPKSVLKIVLPIVAILAVLTVVVVLVLRIMTVPKGEVTMPTVGVQQGEAFTPQNPGAGGEIPDNYMGFFMVQDSSVMFSMNGGMMRIIESYSPRMQMSGDGRLCVYSINRNSAWQEAGYEAVGTPANSDVPVPEKDSYGYDLYATDFVGQPRLIAQNADDAVICADGDSIFYRTSSDLYRYRFSTGENRLVAESLFQFVPSPNGEHVLCADNGLLWRVSLEGPAAEMLQLAEHEGQDRYPVSISDDGQCIAYSQKKTLSASETERWSYYFRQGDEKAMLNYDGYGAKLYQNRTGDDLLLICPGGVYRFAGGALKHLDAPREDRTELAQGRALAMFDIRGAESVTLDCESFDRFFYTAEGSLHSGTAIAKGLYYAVNGEVREVTPTTGTARVSLVAGGSGLFFTDNERLFQVWDEGDGTVQLVQLAESCADFSASPDGQTVFYRVFERPADGGDSTYNLYCWHKGDSWLVDVEVGKNYNVGGPNGIGCTYIGGYKNYKTITGPAYYYSVEGGSLLVAEKARYISPPTAQGSFYYVRPASGKLYDIMLFAQGESRLLFDYVENYCEFQDLRKPWYCQLPMRLSKSYS